MADNPDDIALMAQLAGGDDLALNALMARWKERVGTFLFRMTGNRETALDLTQETFVRLYSSRLKYKPTAAFSTYLFHIAANLARTHARWKSRHPTVPLLDEEGSPLHEPADPRLTPDAAAAWRDQAVAVQRAIDALPADLRQALLLFTLEDMSHAQIGGILGCSAKAAELRIYRARLALKEALGRSA
jgi:RNA polymerase sigma-70 factor (ECF subfamily)